MKTTSARLILACALSFALSLPATAQTKISVAAAADLHGVLDRIIETYNSEHPGVQIDVVYGSSGNLTTQIEQGAPFDVFFSADSDFPERLVRNGKAVGKPLQYAEGHIVLWSASMDLKGVTVQQLTQPRFTRIAIANPAHAPYGKRSEQALRAAGVWDAVQPKIVMGENIAQTAQFIRSGNAQIGFVAESFARSPEAKGSYVVVPTSMYQPLKQSFVLTQHGANAALAKDFMAYVQGSKARAVFVQYGFYVPEIAAPVH
ncbi:molybdate ABC transporter substrate-binding protein [Solilutibacter silvestris]|nr:molybdate ABC transporter substrate-binding protein [Lysobacter silvestris]